MDAGSPRPAATGTGTKTIYGVLGAAVAAYTVSLVVRTNGASWTWLDGWGVSTFELVAGVLVLARAVRPSAYRRFALLLGSGMCLWAFGDFAMTYETLDGRTPATISTANILWAGFYPCAYVGVMILMRQEARKLDAAHYLDGVMGALAAMSLFLAFAFHATNVAAGGDVTNTAINLVYPAGDLLLFLLIGVGIVLLTPGRRLRWALIAAGCLVIAAGDICALFPGLVATEFGTVTNMDAWPVALFLMSLAVWLPPRPPERELESLKPSFVLPSLAAGSSLLVVTVAALGHVEKVGLLFAAGSLLTAGVRFGITLRQMNGLNEQRHRQLEEAARVEQASHEKLESTLRDLEEAARSEQASREALQTAMHGYSAFSDRAAEGASEQSSALADTSTTVDEVRLAAERTAERATEVASRAHESLRVSDEGAQAVATLAEAMEEIRARVEEIAQGIVALSDRTQRIGDITGTVKQLAERSKLLALNASIEAARAGEHGKGFSVVADEVRSLSEQSKEATVQVEDALAEIQAATSAAVNASSEGTRVVERGLELTGRAGDVISSLADTIRDAAESVGEIADSAQRERAGIDRIAVSVEKVNEAAEQLNELYRSLQDGRSAEPPVELDLAA